MPSSSLTDCIIYSYTHTPEDTVQVAMRAGTDLNCGQFYQKYGMVSLLICSFLISSKTKHFVI